MQNIISLIPSATEILCALNLQDRLIGISHECDFPTKITHLPRLTRPTVNSEGNSQQIQSEVIDIIVKALSFYTIETEMLAALKPDLIITQDQCAVCALDLTTLETVLTKLAYQSVQVCSLSPHQMADIYTDILKVGEATRSQAAAKRLVASMQSRLAELTNLPYPRRPRVACIEWLDPVMIGGGWIPELVKMAGGQPVIVEEPQRFKTVDWNQVRAAEPEVILIMPCGFNLPKTLQEIRADHLAEQISMCLERNIRIVCLDGNAYFNRPGPRIVDSAQLMAMVIHPSRSWPQLFENAFEEINL